MPDDFDAILDRLIQREGGWSDHASDRGGCTKYGITKATLVRWRGRGTCADVRAMSENEARLIYRALYWVEPRIYQMPGPVLRELLFDAAVHHGPDRAIKWAQDALRVRVDGIIGPQTLAAAMVADPDWLYRAVLRRRIMFLGRLLTDDPTQAVFAAGWLNRVAAFV